MCLYVYMLYVIRVMLFDSYVLYVLCMYMCYIQFSCIGVIALFLLHTVGGK